MKESRKLLITGNYTYRITLPKAWVKQLKWRAKQRIELELKDERIILKDYPNL